MHLHRIGLDSGGVGAGRFPVIRNAFGRLAKMTGAPGTRTKQIPPVDRFRRPQSSSARGHWRTSDQPLGINTGPDEANPNRTFSPASNGEWTLS